jgi:hypothetical protein
MTRKLTRARPPAWLRQIVKSLEESEKNLPEPAFLKGEFPEWVKRLVRELISTFYPAVKIKIGGSWTAGEVGAIVGQRLAYLHGIAEFPKISVNGAFRKIDRKTASRLKKQRERFAESNILAIQQAILLASVQPYSETVRFFTAFSKGLSKKPTDPAGSNFHRTTTKVYWILLQGWPSVARIRSVRELQQGLCRYLEPYVVGKLKRVEKMCQRLGLQFAPRGRPKKENIQTRQP